MNHAPDDSAGDYLRRWHLEPDGSALSVRGAMLYPVTREGRPLMLKIPSTHLSEQAAFRTLQYYSGCRAVEVLAHTREAILMKRAVPGSTLRQFRHQKGDIIATRHAGRVLKGLHSRPHKPEMDDLPAIGTLLGEIEKAVNLHPVLLPDDLLSLAVATFRQLQQTAMASVVLHGDLHHENILWDDSNGWLAIDPKGFRGDPSYDCAPLFKNPLDAADIASRECLLSRAQILSEVLGYPQSRILHWAFIHAVLSVIWALRDDVDVGPAAPVSASLFAMLRTG